MTMRRVESSDGVAVAVHDLGGHGPALLLSHATGFNAHSYLPMAKRSPTGSTRSGSTSAATATTPAPSGWEVDWRRYGDDASAAARAIAPDGGLIGFGHSMGGSALLMAARPRSVAVRSDHRLRADRRRRRSSRAPTTVHLR